MVCTPTWMTTAVNSVWARKLGRRGLSGLICWGLSQGYLGIKGRLGELSHWVFRSTAASPTLQCTESEYLHISYRPWKGPVSPGTTYMQSLRGLILPVWKIHQCRGRGQHPWGFPVKQSHRNVPEMLCLMCFPCFPSDMSLQSKITDAQNCFVSAWLFWAGLCEQWKPGYVCISASLM